MGANAQTTVPTFVASQVLTADQMNQSARTGVPVFASTVTRDAAFGGTGEKTLAEGQMCYIEGTGLQTYNGSAWVTWGASLPTSGLVTLLAQTTFTGATTVTQDNIFTSSYTFYKILCRYTTSTTFPITLVLRASGSDATSNYNNQRFIAQGTATTVDRQTAQSNIVVGQATNGSFFSQFDCELYGPQLAEATNIRSTMTLTYGAYNTPEWFNIWGNHSTATAYDGFKLAVSTGTMTGVYSVYGYGKTV
jgi:hypothetical protein